MNSLVSMVMPEEGTISCPSLRHVMRMGMSPDDTTQAMYINLPMEVGGKSNGWMSGGTENGREKQQSLGEEKKKKMVHQDAMEREKITEKR